MQVTMMTVILTSNNGDGENVLSVIPPVYKPHANVNKVVTVGCEVLIAVVIKSPIFWDIMPHSPLKF
jgi:hypothetical protein